MLKNLLSSSVKPNAFNTGFNISNNPVCVQSVRWRRKPRWIPMAKSKMFRIPERHVLPPNEAEEWLRLNQVYKAQMRSVRLFFREEVERKELLLEEMKTPADQEAEYQRCNALNEEWNLEIKKIRDERIKKVYAERCAFIKDKLEQKAIREKELLEAIEAKVRKEKELFSSFITRNNIDQAIEYSLANPKDYNYAIDLQGTIYRGDEKPGKIETETPVQNEVSA